MPDATVLLRAVGDIALGDHPLCAGFGTHSQLRSRPADFAFQHVMPVFAGAGNLECTLSESGLRPNDYHSVQMRGHPGYLDGLNTAGFDVLNVANNHSMQHGPQPFVETVAMLRQTGIAACGVRGPGDSSVPAAVVANGLRVAFLGYSLRPRQYFTEEPLYSEASNGSLVADVRAARAGFDVVVVSLHWGDEFIERPSPADIALAHEVMDAGADLIIGHHPHVLRGVEHYGRGAIVYSLGNFVCDMLWEERLRESAILECRLTREGAKEVRLVPVRINDDYQPVPLVDGPAAALAERLARLADDLVQESARPISQEGTERYEVAAALAHREQRARSHRYFLRQAYRFPPRILIQQFTTFARNRLTERGLLAPQREE
jgi:poly-gamma-glutamate synthesis protein (capsule biosynthesis protein)